MNITVRRRAERSGRSAAPLLATMGCGLVLALTGCSGSSGAAAAMPPSGGATYTLMQMNLCLSGLAGCYAKVEYPTGVQDAVVRIREARPDAVTFNEACRGDIVLIARQTGYHMRFSTVTYHGKPLSCVKPGGRGLFGDAVLTEAAIESTDSQPFEAQAGPERRMWLCVSTRVGVDVCTAHLASPETEEAAANGPQCAELRALLAHRATDRTVIFGGDVNRRVSCAPHGFWTRTDASAHQDPGSQHVYGTGALRSPSARVEPATHTDHDILLVSAYRTAHRWSSSGRWSALTICHPRIGVARIPASPTALCDRGLACWRRFALAGWDSPYRPGRAAPLTLDRLPLRAPLARSEVKADRPRRLRSAPDQTRRGAYGWPRCQPHSV